MSLEKYEIRKRLLKCFAELRQDGFLARANFMCCQNCAGSALTEQAVKKIQAGETVKGCVFWHRQDEDDWNRGSAMHIAYGEMDSAECGFIGLPTVEVGRRVVAKLAEYSIPYEWNGDGNERILVKGYTD